jgi:hypothetical protein
LAGKGLPYSVEAIDHYSELPFAGSVLLFQRRFLSLLMVN